MQAIIATHADGGLLEACIRDSVFGAYTVRGSATWSPSTGELSIGTHMLTTGGSQAAQNVVRIAEPSLSPSRGELVAAAALQTGVVARIVVESRLGTLSVTGYVVGQASSATVAVGRHLLRSGSAPDGPFEVASIEAIAVSPELLRPPIEVEYWADAYQSADEALS